MTTPVMRLFRHVVAVHSCTARCGYTRSEVEVSLSPFHALVAAVSAALWCSFSNQKFPALSWSDLPFVLAAELLLVFASGLLVVSPVLALASARGKASCAKCGANLFFAGRHFDPLGSTRPSAGDIFIAVTVMVCNVIFWFAT